MTIFGLLAALVHSVNTAIVAMSPLVSEPPTSRTAISINWRRPRSTTSIPALRRAFFFNFFSLTFFLFYDRFFFLHFFSLTFFLFYDRLFFLLFYDRLFFFLFFNFFSLTFFDRLFFNWLYCSICESCLA